MARMRISKLRILLNLFFAVLGFGFYLMLERMYLYALVVFMILGVYGNWLSVFIIREIVSKVKSMMFEAKTLDEIDKELED